MTAVDRGSALFYGSLYSGAGDATCKADFVESFLENRQSHLIDAAAGVGDLAFELARKGHSVLSFEPSGPMFAVLLDRLRREPAIRHLVAPFPIALDRCPAALNVDAAVSFNHWSHLAPAARVSLLSSVQSALGPGGLFIFNCAQDTPLRPDQPWAEVHRRVFGDTTIRHLASSARVADRSAVRVRFEYVMEYCKTVIHTEASDFLLTLDTPDRVSSLLRDAGFAKIDLRGGFAGADYDPKLPGFVVIARKTGAD